MQVIPVLDLLDSHAVRAMRGQRDDYRPIRSSLAGTSEPVTLARALVDASGARTLYVADLDAILGRGDHAHVVAELCSALPRCEIWLDAGFADYAAMRALFERIAAARSVSSATTSASAPARRPTLVPVFGSESLREPGALAAARADGLAPILSLDYRAGQLIADASLVHTLRDAQATWPARVIAMTLDQVGSYAGPDLSTFARLVAAAPPGTTVIGAGGIRTQDDLLAAAAASAAGWLVASALHDGRLDIAALQQHMP
ncbi:HisA/HisF-related TIM barrel protein [Trinickia sp. LjRoot230]|uniref:HisA/HisF-related TIM barrel protein n=1 Tax=Trinickia sp. LjRoot230 TaxID=3342288 RepID=UPI003ECFF663